MRLDQSDSHRTNKEKEGIIMKNCVKLAILTIAFGFIFAAAGFSADAQVKSPFTNPFTTTGKWYKANLHTHSKLSDGEANLPDVVKEYRRLGYSVLAITDHEKSNNVSGYSDANFILINGMETHPECLNCDVCYHLVCLNLPNGFVMPKELNTQQRIDRVKEAGGEVFFAHPYWSGHNINQILPLKGLIGMEVYNSGCNDIGKPLSSVQWDDLLQAGDYISGFATDDMHDLKSETAGGWVIIKTEKFTLEGIMEALKSGCFYASSGPTIEDFHIENNTVYLRCSPAKEIRILGNSCRGKRFLANGSQLLTKVEEKLSNDSDMRYLRAEIIDSNDKCAWTNPIIIEPAKENKK
jgi:hypothetical protein